MILADTSVWVAHFKGMQAAAALPALLEANDVATHRWVVGELALGGLGREERALFDALPVLPEVAPSEVLVLIDAFDLAGTGIGWVDAQLLASARVGGASLWTRDTRLAAVANALGVAADV